MTSKLHSKVLKVESNNDILLAGLQNHGNDDSMACNNILSSEDSVLFESISWDIKHAICLSLRNHSFVAFGSLDVHGADHKYT
jgi:hypothetical protein